METDEKGNPLTYWGGLEKAIKITLEEAIENKIKGEIVEKGYSEEEVIAFGESCFYKGFEKSENDDANCYTAFREEIGSLFKQFKNK